MVKMFTHRGLILPFVNEDTTAWLGVDEIPHPDTRQGKIPDDSPFKGALSVEASQYWRNFLIVMNSDFVSPLSWFLSDPQHIELFMDTNSKLTPEEHRWRTEIAFDFIRNSYSVPKLIWKQLLSHATAEELITVLALKTGLIKRDINWLANNENVIPINEEKENLYRLIISAVYDLDAMDYLITRLVVRGFMTQRASVLFIDYLHSVVLSFNEMEQIEVLKIRDSLVDWNKVVSKVGSVDNSVILTLLGTPEPTTIRKRTKTSR